jgi:CIC family chloride channel protein
MLFEMTADYQIVLPLMLACVTAHYSAKVYRRGESIYHASLARAAAVGGGDWRVRTVESLVKPATATVRPSLTLHELFAELPSRPLDRVYVTNSGGELVAWLDPRQILEQVQARRLDTNVTVESVASPVTFALEPDMPLGAALDGFMRENANVLPVTLGQWRNTLIGEVSRQDVMLAVADRLTYPK